MKNKRCAKHFMCAGRGMDRGLLNYVCRSSESCYVDNNLEIKIKKQSNKMQVTVNNHYTTINGVDDESEFEIQIQNDCSQIRIQKDLDSVFMNVNCRELKIIRDTLTDIIENK